MRKPSEVFVHVVSGKSHTVSTNSDHIQSTTAFKSPGVRAREFGKAVLLLATFILCGLIPFSVSANVEPVVPDGVSASDGEFQDIIRLSWTDVTGETSYQVFRCISATSCGPAIDDLPADTIQFDDIGDEIIGGYHYYRVKSCINEVCSQFSAPDSGYTQLMSSSGFEDDTVAITSFTINDESNVTLLPGDSANLNWSTRNAQDCVATSSPILADWNQAVSTYGPKTISLPADTAGGTYILDLSCMSALGMEAGKQVTLVVTTEPDAPTLNDVLGLGNRALLSFAANGDGGSVITGYTAKCGEFSNTGNAPSIMVNGLTNGIEYSCSVIATNAIGNSAPSNVETVIPMTIPEAPVLNSAVAGAGSAELFFTAGDDGGDPIIGFEAYCGVFSNTGESSPITVSGLTNGTEYSCFVIAVNGHGQSELSNVELVTPESVPEAPVLVTVIGGDGSAELSFTATGDGGSAITGYTANCNEFSNTGESTPIAVNGLTNDTEYSCSVISTNANGDSLSSNVLSVIPSESVSIIDFQLTTNRGNQPISCGDVEVTLTWEVENANTCYGSWRESEVNPTGDLTSVTSPDTVTIIDLAVDKVFTLMCTDDNQGSTQQQLTLDVKAPCLPYLLKQWDDVFPGEWPYPKSYQVVKQIPEPTSLAIEFNTSDISTVGAVGTIEYSSTRGDRLVAISTIPGDFQVADECREFQFIDGNLLWETGEANDYPDACKLQANTTYYWNTTFSDGINADSGTCTGTPCITYMNTVTLFRDPL